MPDTGHGVGGGVRVNFFDEVDKLADRTAHVEAVVRGQGNTCRVVSAIFEARQATEDNLAATLGRLACNMSNNSAHTTHSSTPTPSPGQ